MTLLTIFLCILLYAAYRTYQRIADDLADAALDIHDAPPSDRTCALCHEDPLKLALLHDGAALVCEACLPVLAHTRAVA